jgi:hypothetical protein
MNDPVAIKFVDEVVRPLSETLRSLSHQVADARASWQNGIGAAITADLNAAVEDGRDAEGVSRLTCNDVALLMAQVEALDNQFSGVGVEGVISKPCVRFM